MFYSRILMVAGAVVFATPASVLAVPAVTPVQIELSHRLDEVRAERLLPLIESFNKQNKDVQVTLVRRAEGDAPKQLNLVTREEYSRFLENKAQFKPLHAVMREAKEKFDAGKLSPELRDGLSDAKGQLFALPLAFSTPVLFINKDLFRKAGLDPENPPKTWAEAQETAGKLADAGNRCPFTTSWPVQIFIDNVSAWNGADVNDAKGKLAFNGLAQVKHIAMMATWYKSKYFSYFGPKDEADNRFANGECGMLTSSSSLFASLNASKSLEVGVSPLPYHDDVYGAPKNTLADGSSLWVANGMKPAETKGVAKFVNYVLGPEIQINLTLAGGYLPMTPVARAAASTKLLGADLGGLKIAYEQLQGKGSSPKVRVAQIESVRQIVEEELETVWADKKPAKEALDSAVARGNAAMLKVAVLDQAAIAPKSKGKGKK